MMQNADGRRLVRAGRGYTYYKVPDTVYKDAVYVDKNVMKRPVVSIRFFNKNRVNHKSFAGPRPVL